MGGARMVAGSGHAAWAEAFNEMFMQVAGVLGNAAVRRHGREYLLGLLSRSERKNSWPLAELAGNATPDGLQRLLNFSPWGQVAARGRAFGSANSYGRWLGQGGARGARGRPPPRPPRSAAT